MRVEIRIFLVFAIILLTGGFTDQAFAWPGEGDVVQPAPLFNGAPQLILTKSIEDDVSEAQVGDVIRYRIRFECSSLTTACGEVEITDTLPTGLTYLPPPNSSVPSGFDVNYNGGTRTVTITKTDNNLLDGTQYDAVIAVRINQDFRPLPAVINNTVDGRIFPPGATAWVNATPASAPPITIGAVSPSWELTKTRVAPIIEPTVDTDVTYQLMLCPVIPPSGGIADLTDIVITDTLPTGAVFVSATNGGTESGGVVTWPTVPGPLSPPDCITRFVTLRYPTPIFSIGDELTNSADVTASYVESDGDPCPDCFAPPTTPITHDIIDPVVVPTYGKSDAGDPVGISGTARFILGLNTNLTNYPANDITLIDNIPPQLQVTSVTSGTWSEDFDYVRAYVEYSTDNGSTWVAFPGQPVLFDTDATYTAPVNNITNIRWRFEYDADGELPFDGVTTVPGLPYVWGFSGSPQIRSTPRTVAINDGNGDPMPLAVIGETYTNCVYVTRTDLTGPVTDPCEEEEITVQGDFASLQVSKSETPGTPWDEWEDPNIDTFTSDATILPGDTLRYVLRVELTERSSAPLVDPTILDTLPDDLIFIRAGDVRLNGTLLSVAEPGAVVNFTNSQPNGNPGADQTLLWEITNLSVPELALGSQVLTVEFFARIPRGQLPGTRTNELFVDTDSVDVICENGIPSSNGCETTDTYIVERSAALRGEKWIRSIDSTNSVVVNKDTFLPDASCPNGGTIGLPGSSNPFTRFPCVSQAFPEGALSPGQYVPPPLNSLLDDFEYSLRIFNDGNVEMINYVLYDILPYYGDKGSGGTLSSSDRESEFRPVLTGPVQFISGGGLSASDFEIEYNLSANACRPEVFNTSGLVPPGCDNSWIPTSSTLTWTATEWAEVRTYRIVLNSGSEILPIQEGDTTNMVLFGVPMSIPEDSPLVDVFNNDDAQTLEIAWNSFSHVGSYQDVLSNIRDLLASEPRKVGITIPERFSIGNRVWRDSDNSGTINAPDDSDPGIANVLIHLYAASDTNTPLATTLTDNEGYYLFSNLPEGDYVVGIPSDNFDTGGPLENLRSSTGTPSVSTYTNPTDPNPDSSDHGIDPVSLGDEVFSPVINLAQDAELSGESDLSNNDRDGPVGTRRGKNGERDSNSDLTVDFGFFGGTDIPFSIGNHLWFDDGRDLNGDLVATINDGIRQAAELPVVGARVNLYRDGNLDGILDAAELIRWDTTDAGGFYLFDNLDPGSYYVEVAASNFDDGGVLAGWYSSQPTGTETVGVNGNSTTADIDNDDNGNNAAFPETTGVQSGVIVLERDVDEPLGEAYLSGDADPGSPANAGYNPTGWDGPDSRGRFGEPDENSNLTIDFGFIPPMSLGNRVWIDNGAGEATFRAGYNNGIQDGTEAGVAGVRVELYLDDGDNTFDAGDTLLYFTSTDASGYYLFDRLPPGNYFVHLPNTNFDASGDPLFRYISSFDRTAPADNGIDINDNGVDVTAPATSGVTSSLVNMNYNTEPIGETDLGATYGPDGRGQYGQLDENSDLTIDFGFVQPPRSIGNHLWYDEGAGGGVVNDRIRQSNELPVVGARVSLYLDSNNNGAPDGLAIAYDITDSNGFYLFDNLPPGRYLVGVDNTNFQSGGPLEGYISSVGTTTNADQRDNGIDRVLPYDAIASPYGILSANVNVLVTTNSPTGESHLSSDTGTALGFNPTEDDGTLSRGRYGEADNRSNLRIDFGFFRPLSLGNRVFYDNGAGANLDNGIMDADENGVAGVQVQLWRESNGTPGLQTTGATPDVRATYDGTNFYSDVTDAGGFYLFDRLVPGNYYVYLPPANFTGAGTLRGWYNSTPTGTETLGVNGGAATADLDRDDNGINNAHPDINGIASGLIVLAWDAEPTGETELSGSTTNPGSPTNDDFSPTSWDGPDSSGRWGETDDNSNLTIDFGFIPPLSLGNRVWLDNGDTATGLDLIQFNDGLMNGTESGRSGVILHLFYDADGDSAYTSIVDGVDESLPYRTTTTDANGHYLFDGLPEGRFFVLVAPENFDPGGVLEGYRSSDGNFDNETGDLNDNGIDDPAYLSDGIASRNFVLNYGAEPQLETDISADTATFGPLGIGRFGETDPNSNLTLDFGFVALRSLGNRVWLDNGVGGSTANNGVQDGTEPGIDGVAVSLYPDSNGDGTPDGSAILTTTTSDGGYYLFSNFPAGQYVVGIDASNFQPGGALEMLVSSLDVVAPVDADPDQDDHGIDSNNPPVTGILSPNIDLRSPSNEPTGETDLSGRLQDGPDSRGTLGEADNESDLTVDFGFTYLYSVGNRVWLDTNNNAAIDFADGEVGVDGVNVSLYAADGSGEPTGAVLATATTSDGGYYLFDNLYPGDYVVVIPASNFAASAVLEGYWSSGTTRNADGSLSELVAPDPDNDVDSEDNGTRQASGTFAGAVISQAVTLGATVASEPAGETDLQAIIGDGDQPDARANMTVDFGFYTVSLGDLVWADADRDGEYDAGEPLFDGATINLYAEDGTTLLATTTTNASGEYRFEGLPEGTYVVAVIAPDGTFSTVDTANNADTSDPDQNEDDNDNGVGLLGGEVFSEPVTLTPGDDGAQNENSVDDATGATYNPTLDFGFTPVYSLGNRVWFDTNNNRAIDFGDELGIDGVLIQLFDTLGNEIPVGPDGILGTVDDAPGGMLTDNGGYYLFNGLEAGEYVVVLPVDNFASGEVLEGYWSSGTTRNDDASLSEIVALDPDDNVDSDDNGTFQTSGAYNGGVISLPVTLGPVFDEPENETDLDSTLAGTQQGQPDAQANMTLDFGFYTIQLGNQVWNDLDNNGLLDGAEAGINGVVVQLWSGDGTTLLATTTTATVGLDQGVYTFSGLPQGNYLVRLPEANFLGSNPLRDYYSSTGGSSEPAPNPDTDLDDSDDNGSEVGVLGFAGGYIQSTVFALAPQAEQSFDHSLGLTTEFRVDFGVYNNAQADLEVTKTDNQDAYIPGGTLTYTIVVTNNGPADVNNVLVEDAIPLDGSLSPFFTNWSWTCVMDGGATGCDDYTGSADFSDTVNMPLDSIITYTVAVDIAPGASGPLENRVTVLLPGGYTDPEPDNNEDDDTDVEAGLTVTKTDGLSIVAPGSTLTYTITVENTGAQDLTGIQLVDVIPVGTDFDSASDGGVESIGVVTWPTFDLASGASLARTLTVIVQDEQTLADAAIASLVNTVSVADDGDSTDGDPVTDDDTDTDNIAVSNVKQLTATSEPDSTTSPDSGFERVFIGETLTYQIQIILPPGTVTNLVATDTLEEGLAFDECTPTGVVVPTGVNVTLPGGVTSACPDAGGDPRVTDDGHIVQFTFGTVENTTGSDQTITVEYTAVVLDIASNRDGMTGINNAVVWMWDGGTLAGEADPVEIVEPDMDIVKDAEPTVASIGDTITFTLDIFHTAESTADAYDVEVTDILPSGLGFVPGSVVVTGLAPTTESYDSLTNTLVFTWDYFPLGQTSLLEFEAVLLDAPVVNSANVAWTSLPIDPGLDGLPVQQSNYNIYSTERWYDPTDPAGINSYGRSSSVGIELLVLPDTGFAPDRVTALPERPEGLAYESFQDMRLEIPSLGMDLPIMSIPVGPDGWDLTWLSTQAGYLQGTTLPGNVGNTALTGHVYLADGTPGPFVDLHKMYWGQKIILHVDGYIYTYEVRENRILHPWNTSVLRDDGYAWLTLITCKDYNELTGEYANRVAVRAVLLEVTPASAP